ncbi:MAG: lytic transglycosylase, partial [bacterium]
MILKKIVTFVLILTSSALCAQDDLSIQPFKKPQTKKEVLDSVKATFVHDNIASCIDSLWMKELVSLDLYNDLTTDIKNINIDEKVDYELSTELLKERIKREIV